LVAFCFCKKSTWLGQSHLYDEGGWWLGSCWLYPGSGQNQILRISASWFTAWA
jgi:hypothetical protein